TGNRGILSPREFRMKGHPELQDRGNSTVRVDAALGRLGSSRCKLEQRTFARAIMSNDAQRFPLADRQVDIAQYPYRLMSSADPRNGHLKQSIPWMLVTPIGLAQVAESEHRHQSSSTMSPALAWKVTAAAVSATTAAAKGNANVCQRGR